MSAPCFAALGSVSIGPIVLVFFLSTLGFASFETTLALFLNDAPFLKDAEGTSQRKRSEVRRQRAQVIKHYQRHGRCCSSPMSASRCCVTQGFIYRRLAKHLSELTFMVLGIVFMFAGVGLLSLVCYGAFVVFESTAMPLMLLLFTALTLAVMGFAFLTPSAQALISRRTAADRQGEISGHQSVGIGTGAHSWAAAGNSAVQAHRFAHVAVLVWSGAPGTDAAAHSADSRAEENLDSSIRRMTCR